LPDLLCAPFFGDLGPVQVDSQSGSRPLPRSIEVDWGQLRSIEIKQRAAHHPRPAQAAALPPPRVLQGAYPEQDCGVTGIGSDPLPVEGKGKSKSNSARDAHANFAPHTSPSFQNVVLPAVWPVFNVRA
jgi:hypothetical protein